MGLPCRGRLWFSASLFLGALLISGCATVAEEIGRMAAFSQCQFRLASVTKTTLAGVPLQGGTIEDINLMNLAKLQSAFSSGTLPLRFTLGMEVKNPNTRPAGMSRMEWNALLDGERLTSGVLEEAFEVGAEKTGTLPLAVILDLTKLFSGKTLDSMVGLALNVAGEGEKPTRVTLQVKPSMTVGGQPLS
jgi:hypothetical protein